MRRIFSRRIVLILCAFCAAIGTILVGNIPLQKLPPAIARTIPLTTYQGAPIFDPAQWTLEDLPAFTQAGQWQVPQSVIDALGFDPSTSWRAGDRPVEVLKLGTFQNAFALESFNLQRISELTGIQITSLPLQQFELISWQSIASLVSAVPGLHQLLVRDIAPISDLVRQSGSWAGSLTVGELLQTNPELVQLRLGEHLDLAKYSLTSIPGLTTTQLGSLAQASNSTIAGVPGLGLVKANQFPIPLSIPLGSVIAQVDLPLHTREGVRRNTQPISGSDRVGFNVPCQVHCSHLETATGQQWFAGDQQRVAGGEGILGQTFGGQEPTGRHPYGPAFKVVVANVNEAAGTIDTQLFFRFCQHGLVDLGCTPYGIGPVPFLSYRESQPIFLGVLQSEAPASQFSSPIHPAEPNEAPLPGSVRGIEARNLEQSPNLAPVPIDPTFGFVQL